MFSAARQPSLYAVSPRPDDRSHSSSSFSASTGGAQALQQLSPAAAAAANNKPSSDSSESGSWDADRSQDDFMYVATPCILNAPSLPNLYMCLSQF
jgi:hypothetical protein